MSTNQRRSGQGSFPLDNLTYDLITILYEKSKALEAYDKYLQDAQNNQEVRNLLQQIRQQDQQHIQQLQQHLSQLLGNQGSVSGAAGGGTAASDIDTLRGVGTSDDIGTTRDVGTGNDIGATRSSGGI